MVHILFVHAPSDLYGASRSLMRLSTELLASGVRVTVVVKDDGPLLEHLGSIGATVHIYPRICVITRSAVKSPAGLIRLFRDFLISPFQVARLARRIGASLIQSNTSLNLTGAVAAKLARIPHVWNIRENFSEFGAIWKVMRWFIVKSSAAVVCNSALTAKQFGNWASGVTVIYNGFPPEDFGKAAGDEFLEFRKVYGLEGKVVVILVGRIKFHRKGQEVFAKAAALVRRTFSNVAFLCVGSPFPGNEEHLQRLRELVADLGISDAFKVTGDIADVRIAYAAADISVMASVIPEAFGNVIAESMLSGLPVVASSNGGAREQVIDGVTGILVPPDDPKALADAICQFVNDAPKREAAGRQGRLVALEKFSTRAMLKAYQVLYREILGS